MNKTIELLNEELDLAWAAIHHFLRDDMLYDDKEYELLKQLEEKFNNEKTIYCDRCGKKCGGTSYYKVNIEAYDINPSEDGRVSTETFINNLYNKSEFIFDCKDVLCKSCINEINEFIKRRNNI